MDGCSDVCTDINLGDVLLVESVRMCIPVYIFIHYKYNKRMPIVQLTAIFPVIEVTFAELNLFHT